MRFAAKPGRYDNPGSCAVHPGRFSDQRGGVDLGSIADGPNGPVSVWISYEGLRTIMRQVPQMDLAEGSEVRKLAEQLDFFQDELARVALERDELQAKYDRIAAVARDGFAVKKVVGRPATKKEGATA